MSARDDVLDTMSYAEDWYQGPRDEAERYTVAELDRYRDEVLREAAERIRGGHPDRCPDFADGAEWAAGLIDPEVAS